VKGRHVWRARRLVLAFSVLCALGAASAYASSSGSVKVLSTAQAESLVPTLDRDEYVHYGKVTTSLYDQFVAPKKPWKICFSDAYEGNSWRVRARQVAALMVSNWQKAGIVSGPLVVEVSNSSVPTQITQIRSLIDQGCSAIVAYLASNAGFTGVIQEAFQHHVAFVSMDGDPGSPYAMNTGSNNYTIGAQLAQAIVTKLHGKGNVVMEDGIAGSPVTVAENQGAHDTFSKSPGIKVIAEVNGDWTPSVGKTAMLQVLATHPQSIDAVWATGETSNVIGEAFLQDHRPLPKIIEGSASGYELGWWKQHYSQVAEVHAAILPEPEIHQGFRVAIRLLEGQHPKINTVLQNVPLVTTSNFTKYWRTCMTPDSTTAYPVPPADPQPDSALNAFFTNGANTPSYTYTNDNLNPCGSSK
jgi:ribose transport system substrate-binding protein